MSFEAVTGAVAFVSSTVSRVRKAVGKARSVAEQKVNVAVHRCSELIEELGEMLSKAKCAVETKGGKPPVASFCSTWRLVVGEGEGEVMIIRTKPATTISLRGGRLVFARDGVRLETDGTKVKLCKWRFCLEFDPANREEVEKQLPYINYLLREVGWYVDKSLEGLRACLKREAPECLKA